MEDVGEPRTPPQQCEDHPNGVGKLKCPTGNFERRQNKDCNIGVGVPDRSAPKVNTAITYQSCREKSGRELWTPLKRHRRLKLDAAQLPDDALPSAILFPQIFQQQNNVRPITSAMEAEPLFPKPDVSKSAFHSTCIADSKPSMLVPSISPSRNAEPTVSGSYILSVLQELHRLKTIFNGNNSEEVRNGPEQSLPENAGGAQTSDDLSESGDSHSNDASMEVTEAGEEICTREQANIETFSLRVSEEEAPGKMTCANRLHGRHFSVSRNDSNEGLCETEEGTKVHLHKFESSTTPILKKCRGEDQPSPSSPTQIHVGINPFYHHGLQPFKLFEVRKEIQYENLIMDLTREVSLEK